MMAKRGRLWGSASNMRRMRITVHPCKHCTWHFSSDIQCHCAREVPWLGAALADGPATLRAATGYADIMLLMLLDGWKH